MTLWKIRKCRETNICYLCDLNGKKSRAAFAMKWHFAGLGIQSITVCDSHATERGHFSEGLEPL